MKPRILQLVDSFDEGGSERQALQLTRLLDGSGRYEVFLASLKPDGVLRADIDRLGLGEIPSYPLNSFLDRNAMHQLRNFVRHLRTSKIDLIHTHDFYTNIFGMTAGFLAGVSVRIASRRETNGMRSNAQRRAERIAFRLANRIVANSESVRQRLVEEGMNEKKIRVIYNGLDLRRVAPVSELEVVELEKHQAGKALGREGRLALAWIECHSTSGGKPPFPTKSLLNLNISSDGREAALKSLGISTSATTRFVTIVANMRHEVKDYPMFLRAARRVKDECPDVGFLLAGEGALKSPLQALAVELGIASSTTFLGRVENIAQLLQLSDVCVLSSKAEGFSNSILEYMAAARPVVATDVGGAREAIVEGETGHLVPSGNDQLMAERIVSLLGAPDRARRMGENGRLIVVEKFSTGAQLRETEKLYDELLAARAVIRDGAKAEVRASLRGRPSAPQLRASTEERHYK